jgi:hypothetical protein
LNLAEIVRYSVATVSRRKKAVVALAAVADADVAATIAAADAADATNSVLSYNSKQVARPIHDNGSALITSPTLLFNRRILSISLTFVFLE